jgi:hypothetical protein
LMPKVERAGYVMDQMRVLDWCEVAKAIKMLVEARAYQHLVQHKLR